MAQVTDFSVANGTGSSVRADINDIFAASVSLNSGSSEPSGTKYSYMWWADTTNNLLKQRNAANNAWVTILSLGVANGGYAVAASPTFTGDVTFTGASHNVVFDASQNALEFADSAKAVFGTGGDLEIFHNASNSVINDAGTGDLLLQLGGTTKLSVVSGGVSLAGGAACNITALSDGATITIDMATALHHSVTLGGNRTFAAPSNQVVGQSGSLFITQDGTGSRTAAWNAAFKWAGGTAPTLSTAAGAVDRIDYLIKASNVIHAVATLDVK